MWVSTLTYIKVEGHNRSLAVQMRSFCGKVQKRPIAWWNCDDQKWAKAMPNLFIWWAALQQEERDRIWKRCGFSSFLKLQNIKPIIHALAAVPPTVPASWSSRFWSTAGTATAAAPVPGQATASCGADICRSMTVLEAGVFMEDQRKAGGVRWGWHEGRTAVLLKSLSGGWSTYTVIFGLCQASIFSF